jgi:hypothetical protein
MAETSNSQLGHTQTDHSSLSSTTEAHAAVREARERLGAGLRRTANHVHLLLTTPPSARPEAREGGFVGGVVTTIAVVGRISRLWSDAKRTGVLRKAAIGAVAVAFSVVTARKRSYARRSARAGGRNLVDVEDGARRDQYRPRAYSGRAANRSG